MRAFALVYLVAVVGGRLAAWLLRRRRASVADAIRAVIIVFTYAGLGVILAAITLEGAREDGALVLLLTAGLALLGVWSFALAGFLAWMFITTRGSDESNE